MPETEGSLRERALAAWQERRQEMAVEVERRENEYRLMVLKEATERAWRLVNGNPRGVAVPPAVVEMWAEHAGITASVPERAYGGGPWTVDLTLDGITFRWTSTSMTATLCERFELVAECPDCGADVLFGHRIDTMEQLGTALDEQERNPKSFHRCPEAEDRDDDGEPMVEIALTVDEAPDADPASVLLDAFQGYIHAAIDSAWDAKRYPPGEPFAPNEQDAF